MDRNSGNPDAPTPEYGEMEGVLEHPSSAAHEVAGPNGVCDIAHADGFRRAYERHSLAVYRYVASRLGVAAAEDVTAEVFVEAWRSRARFTADRGESIEAWFMGVATNVMSRHREREHRWTRMSIDAARLLGGDPGASGDMSDVDGRIDAAAHRARVEAALARIPQREREPLLMYVVASMSYEEIGIALGIPVGTVRSRISRGRRRLQDRIGR